MRTFSHLASLFVAWSVVSAAQAGIACVDYCPSDLNSSGDVSLADLGILLSNYGCEGNCEGDINVDGVVDLGDLGAMLSVYEYGYCQQYQYPDTSIWPEEVVQIGLEAAIRVYPSYGLLARVEQDLAAIRAFEPSLALETHSPAWAPTSLIVGLVPGQPTSVLDCANAYYGATVTGFLPSISVAFLSFPAPVNPEVVSQFYAQQPGVQYAEPDGFFGGQNFWIPKPGGLDGSGVWTWNVDDGFHDCFDGCDCHRVFTFQTTENGDVSLISQDRFGQPWCEFPR